MARCVDIGDQRAGFIFAIIGIAIFQTHEHIVRRGFQSATDAISVKLVGDGEGVADIIVIGQFCLGVGIAALDVQHGVRVDLVTDTRACIKIASGVQAGFVAGGQDIALRLAGFRFGIFTFKTNDHAAEIHIIADHAAIYCALVIAVQTIGFELDAVDAEDASDIGASEWGRVLSKRRRRNKYACRC